MENIETRQQVHMTVVEAAYEKQINDQGGARTSRGTCSTWESDALLKKFLTFVTHTSFPIAYLYVGGREQAGEKDPASSRP